MMLYKDERPTSNIERPMSNETNTELFLILHLFKLKNLAASYGECARYCGSKFDVGRSMFDVHSFSSVKTT